VADKWSLALGTEVRVDPHALEEWATWLIGGNAAGRDLAIPAAAADALNLLPGFYDDWALIERERVRQRLLHALEALSEQLAAVGRYADAIEPALLATSAERALGPATARYGQNFAVPVFPAHRRNNL
jgi:hypothetical protein